MNKFMWILGATCLGVAAYVLLTDANGARPQYADGLDEVRDNIGQWGTGKRVTGTGGAVGGKLKQGVGKLTGNDKLQGEGFVDEAVGNVKDAAGKAAHSVSDAISDLKS